MIRTIELFGGGNTKYRLITIRYKPYSDSIHALSYFYSLIWDIFSLKYRKKTHYLSGQRVIMRGVLLSGVMCL